MHPNALFHRNTLFQPTVRNYPEGMSSSAWKSLALVCALLVAAPVRAETDPPSAKPAPTSRRQLSQLAQALDSLLFEEGSPHGLHPINRNLFRQQHFSQEQMNSALEEVKAFRGQAYRDLEVSGSKFYDDYQKKISEAGLGIMRAEGVRMIPSRDVVASWSVLVATGKAGEAPLPPEKIDAKARILTEQQFPLPFVAADGQGLEDPSAKWLYGRNRHRVETFETQPKAELLPRVEFEAWRQQQIQALADRLRSGVVRLVQASARTGKPELFWLLPAEEGEASKAGEPVSVEEVGDALAPLTAERRVEGNRVWYEIKRNLSLQATGARGVMIKDKANLNLGRGYAGSWNEGKLEPERAAEDAFAKLIPESNAKILDALKILNGFQYEHYKQDRGKNFVRALKALDRDAVTALNKQLEIPPITAARDHLRGFPPGFERALWAKFEKNPSYWTDTVEQKQSFYDKYIGLPSSWWDLSATPPTPLAEKMQAAKESLWWATKRYGAIPAALAAVVALESQFGILPTRPLVPSPGTHESPSSKMPGSLSAIQPAFNKRLPKGDGAPLYTIASDKPDSEIPRRFSVGSLEKTKTGYLLPETTAADFTVNSKGFHEGIAEIPTGDNTHVASARVTGADGQPWKPQTDYTVEGKPDGEIVIVPKRAGAYRTSVGFYNNPEKPSEIKNPALSALDHEKIESVAKELGESGFKYLPQLLRKLVETSRKENRPISIFNLQDTISSAAYYSQVPESFQLFGGFRSEFGRAARFLNPNGISCYECDGARELAVPLFKKILEGNTDIEITPRNILARKSNVPSLSLAGLHADFLIRDKKNDQKFVIDTTPGKFDPMDPDPPTSDQTSFVDRPKGQPERVAHEGPPDVKTIPLSEKPLHESPFPKMVADLFAMWRLAKHDRLEIDKVPRTAVSAAGGPDPKENTEVAEAEAPVEGHVTVAKEIEATGRWELDHRIPEIEKLLKNARDTFAASKLIPKTPYSPLPSLQMMRLGRLITRRLGNEISDEDFRKEAKELVPENFEWPIGNLDRQIKALVKAAKDKQWKTITAHREAWAKRRTQEYPGLLSPIVLQHMQNFYRYLESETWQEPRFVRDVVGTTCQHVARAAN